jgi:hypothetical protein
MHVSPLLANIYMHRFIKAFRKYGLDRRYGAVLVTYADEFVVLCQHGATEVLDTTRRWMASIGFALNEPKTRVCHARTGAEPAPYTHPGAPIRTQRLFGPTTIPAIDWRAPLYSHEPASIYLAGRASGDAKRAQI